MRDELRELLRCPACQGTLAQADEQLVCAGCRRGYPIRLGIPAVITEASPLYASVAADALQMARTGAERQRDYWEADHGHREFDHPIVAGFARQRWAHLARVLPLDDLRTTLDVGAGNGFSTAYAPAHLRSVATDGSWRMLARHPGEDRVLADAQSLPFADASFDLVYCWELLHHVQEPWRVLAEMRRVSRGWVCFFEPNPLNLAQFLFSLADPEHRWVLRYRVGYVRDQVERAGLDLVRHQRVGLTFPNKTPGWLYPVLQRLPFRVPLIGISHLVVARVAR